MKLLLQRLFQSKTETIGVLYVNGFFHGFILEDIHRDKKVMGETRIPAGHYKIGFNISGHMHSEYTKKFAFHKGMLELLNVPNFTTIYIHIGNKDEDTKGCLLIGSSVNATYSNSNIYYVVSQSTLAYENFYPEVAEAVKKGEEVIIDVKDEEALS
jgi:hypothetical protein